MEQNGWLETVRSQTEGGRDGDAETWRRPPRFSAAVARRSAALLGQIVTSSGVVVGGDKGDYMESG